ncbi:MAG: hypothetical protein SEPTF4163_006210 [Sporothrix epigloea]
MGSDNLMVSPVEVDNDVDMLDISTAKAAVPAIEPASSEPQLSQSSHSSATAHAPEQPERKMLPRVTSVAPAAFVPLDDDIDLTQSFDAPQNEAEQARFILKTLDYHQDGVRQGFLFLADLDRRRIIGEVEAREEALEKARATAEAAITSDSPLGTASESAGVLQLPARPAQHIPPPYDDETLSHDEIDAMIDAMHVPAPPGVDYNMIPLIEQQPLPIMFPPAGDEVPGGRREAARQLSQVVEEVLRQISGYDAHINGLRGRWIEILERETMQLDTQLGAPARTAMGASFGH